MKTLFILFYLYITEYMENQDIITVLSIKKSEIFNFRFFKDLFVHSERMFKAVAVCKLVKEWQFQEHFGGKC